MKNFYKNIRSLFNRELKLVSKDINILLIVLIAPIFYSFFYSTIYMNKIETDLPIAVIDNDRTETTRTLLRNLDAHQQLSIYEVVPEINNAKDLMMNGEAQAAILIPQNFERDLKLGHGSEIKVYLNTTRFLVSNDVNKAVNEVIATVNGGIRLKYLETKGYSSQQARQMVQPVYPDIRPLFNFIESYGDFLIPGMLVLILQQTLLIGLSESMAKEREFNLLNDLFTTANYDSLKVLTGKGLFYFVLYSVYAMFFFSVNFSLLKINFLGSVSAVIVLTAVLLISVILMSLTISSFFKRKIVSLQVLAFSSYPIFLISGYSWPLQAMPFYIKTLAMLLPSTPYLNAFNRITQMGAGFNDVLPELIHMLILLVLYLGLALWRFKILENHINTNETASIEALSNA